MLASNAQELALPDDEIDDEGQNDALVNLSTMWRRR
jgi:hypothetical protein